MYLRRQLMPAGYQRSSKLLSQVAIVATGEPGIGRAITVLFAREGADIKIVDLLGSTNGSAVRESFMENFMSKPTVHLDSKLVFPRLYAGPDRPEYEPSKISPEIPTPDEPSPNAPNVGDPPNTPTPMKDPPPSDPDPSPSQPIPMDARSIDL